MILSSLLDPNEIIRVGAKAGGIQALEASVLNTILSSATIKKEISGAVERTAKLVK